MNFYLQIFIFVAHFSTFVYADLITTKSENIDALYSKLLDLPADEMTSRIAEGSAKNLNNEQIVYKLILGVFFHDCGEILSEASEKSNLTPDQSKVIESKREAFDQMMMNMKEMTMFSTCVAWKLWRQLGDSFVGNRLLTSSRDRFVLNREKLHHTDIDCIEIEKFLENNGGSRKDVPWSAQIYLSDLTLAHFNAILFLLAPKNAREKLQIGTSFGANHRWEHSDLFAIKKSDWETNFAFQLRQLGTKDRNNNREKIMAIKQTIAGLVGRQMLILLEQMLPIHMALDFVSDDTLAVEYTDLLSVAPKVVAQAELRLSVRLLFGRIFKLVAKSYRSRAAKNSQSKRKNEILTQIGHLWDKNSTNMLGEMAGLEPQSLVTMHGVWYRMAELYNGIPNLKADERVEIIHADIVTGQGLIEKVVRNELMADHLRNMDRLYFAEENSFRKIFQNHMSFAIKQRTREFFESQFSPENMLSDYMNIMGQRMGIYPALKFMLRHELSEQEITQRQISDYIELLDANTVTEESTRAQMRINTLAYYQSIKSRLEELSDELKKVADIDLAWMELWMDTFARYDRVPNAAKFWATFITSIELRREQFWPHEAEMDKKKVFKKMHNEVVGRLLDGQQEFRKKLKGISINDQRMRRLLGNHSQLIEQLIKESRGKQPQEAVASSSTNPTNEQQQQQLNSFDFEEAIDLANYYQRIFMDPNPISEQDRDQLSIDAQYFHQKHMIKKFIQLADTFMSNGSQRVKKMVLCIKREADEAKLLAPLDKWDYEERRKQICYFDSILDRLFQNGLLYWEVPKWRSRMLEKGYVTDSTAPMPSEADKAWVKPDCENPKVREGVLKGLFVPPLMEGNHYWMLIKLIKRVSTFTLFIKNNISALPGIQEYVNLPKESTLALYNKILAVSDDESALLVESQLALDPLLAELNALEDAFSMANPEFVKELPVTKMQLFLTMKIIDVFTISSQKWRLICPLISYIGFLKLKMKCPVEVWEMTQHIKNCFDPSQDDLLAMMRQKTAKWHYEFLEDHLANCDINDHLLTMMRDNIGSMARMTRMVAPVQNLRQLWGKARHRLINRNFFNDDISLLEHYRRVLTESEEFIRVGQRMAADIMAWMSSMDSEWGKIGQNLSEIWDEIWLTLRIYYDESLILNADGIRKLSYELRTYLSGVNDLMIRAKMQSSSDPSKLMKIWADLYKNGEFEAESRWIESEKFAGPIPFVQKIHLEKLEKFAKNQHDNKEISQDFAALVEELKGNEAYRRNLLHLLKLEDINEFLKNSKIEFRRAEFKPLDVQNWNVAKNDQNLVGISSSSNIKNKRKKAKKTKKSKPKPRTESIPEEGNYSGNGLILEEESESGGNGPNSEGKQTGKGTPEEGSESSEDASKPERAFALESASNSETIVSGNAVSERTSPGNASIMESASASGNVFDPEEVAGGNAFTPEKTSGNPSNQEGASENASSPGNIIRNATNPERSSRIASNPERVPRNASNLEISSGNASNLERRSGNTSNPERVPRNASNLERSSGNASNLERRSGNTSNPEITSKTASNPGRSSGITSNPEKSSKIASNPERVLGNVSNPERRSGNASNQERVLGNATNPERRSGNSPNSGSTSKNASNPARRSGIASNPERGFGNASNLQASSGIASKQERRSGNASNPESTSKNVSNPARRSGIASNLESTSKNASNPERSSGIASNPERSSRIASIPENTSKNASIPERSSGIASNPERRSRIASIPENTSKNASIPERSSGIASNPERRSGIASNLESTSKNASIPERSSGIASNLERSSRIAFIPENTSKNASIPERSSENASNLPYGIQKEATSSIPSEDSLSETGSDGSERRYPVVRTIYRNAERFRQSNVPRNYTDARKYVDRTRYYNSEVPPRKEFLQEISTINSLKDFCSDVVLYHRYKDFLKFNTLHKRCILDAGVLINEIEHRSLYLAELNTKFAYFSDQTQVHELLDEWNRCKTEILGVNVTNLNMLYSTEEMLYHMLVKIMMFLVKDEPSLVSSKLVSQDKLHIKMQLHIHKLALGFATEPELERIWNLLDRTKQRIKFQHLVMPRVSLPRFEGQVMDVKRMLEQTQLDQSFYNLMSSDEKRNCFNPELAKISQQLHPIWHRDDEIRIAIELNVLLTKTAYNEEHDRKIDLALKEIDEIVKEWSDSQARILITGSYLFGTHTLDSDINLICIVPGQKIEGIQFFGNEESICMQNNECSAEIETHLSLFCRLCKNVHITHLVKITSGTILIVQFKYYGVQFDISFVSIPGQEMLASNIDDTMVGEYAAKFDVSNGEHKKMLRTLSSYRSNLYIINLLEDQRTVELDKSENKLSKLRSMVLALKRWSKENFIYCNKFGYLNGIILTIMATKIILLYPDASIWFLMEKFFLIYTTRAVNLPIQLGPTNLETDIFSVRNKHEQQMPVYTPVYPHQNAARLVTQSAAKIIRQQMIGALNLIKSMNLSTFDWNLLLNNSVPFLQKYDNYLLVNCMAQDEAGRDKLCQFVEWRIRLQLLFNVEQGGNVESQLYPDAYQENCALPNHLLDNTNMGAKYCKVWLVGVNFLRPVDVQLISKNLDWSIKMDYLKFHPVNGRNPYDINGSFSELGLQLKSIFVKRTQLEQIMTVDNKQV